MDTFFQGKFSDVHPDAQIAEGVEIGSFCYIGPNVKIGKGTKIGSSVIIDGYVTIGENNQIYHHTVIGSPPQDFSYKLGDRTYLKIGNNNIIHEYVTISPGTKPESETVIGDNCMIMIGAHIAHNIKLGNNVVIVNYTALGGYTEIGDGAFVSGFVAVHQFCRIGRLAMIAPLSKLAQDMPPFMTGQDIPVTIYALNTVGLMRSGLDADSRGKIKKAYKILYHDKYNFSDAVMAIEEDKDLMVCNEVVELTEFIKNAKRGICKHH